MYWEKEDQDIDTINPQAEKQANEMFNKYRGIKSIWLFFKEFKYLWYGFSIDVVLNETRKKAEEIEAAEEVQYWEKRYWFLAYFAENINVSIEDLKRTDASLDDEDFRNYITKERVEKIESRLLECANTRKGNMYAGLAVGIAVLILFITLIPYVIWMIKKLSV